MSGLSAGLATFNSCNKAGSIPHFTQHLSRYPNDYDALMWRGRAYSIIGEIPQARADFLRAGRVSVGPKKNLAEAHINHIDGNSTQKAAILHSTVQQFPYCSEAWSELGSHTYRSDKKVDLSLQYLRKATHLATLNSEVREPWYPWCNQTIGDIYYYEKQQLQNARSYYETAVKSGSTLTIGYLGLSRCDILSDNLASAKRYFSTAKRLNPVLVKWETFGEFSRGVKDVYAQLDLSSMLVGLFESLYIAQRYGERARAHQQTASSQSQYYGTSRGMTYNAGTTEVNGPSYPSLPSSSQYSGIDWGATPRTERPYSQANTSMGAQRRGSNTNYSGKRGMVESASGYNGGRSGGSRGSGGNGGGSRDGGGSDKEKRKLSPLEEAENKWKKLKAEAPDKRKFGRLHFYQSKCKKYWHSKIPPEQQHGGAFLKRYIDKGRTIELLCSLDFDLKQMHGKHESGIYAKIKKSDMHGF